MRLKALHRIEGKNLKNPGDEFSAEEAVGKRLISLGAAVEIPQAQTEEGGGRALSAKETIELIAQLTDAAEIKKYLDDARSTVAAAAEKRLAELKGK